MSFPKIKKQDLREKPFMGHPKWHRVTTYLPQGKRLDTEYGIICAKDWAERECVRIGKNTTRIRRRPNGEIYIERLSVPCPGRVLITEQRRVALKGINL